MTPICRCPSPTGPGEQATEGGFSSSQDLSRLRKVRPVEVDGSGRTLRELLVEGR